LIKIDLQQGTELWHRWRLDGVGASELAMVLNESPYGNRKDLLNEKITGISAKKIPEFLERKGKEIEAKVRAKYELTSDGEFQAICAEQDANGFIRCSFDGYGEFPI